MRTIKIGRIKKLISLLLILCLLVSLCVACGEQPSKTQPTEALLGSTFEPGGDVSATDEPSPSPSPAPTEEPTATPSPTAIPSPTPGVVASVVGESLSGLMQNPSWSDSIEVPIVYDYVVSKVQNAMNVRSGPGIDYEIIGQFRANSYGKILEREEGWTKIQSGDVIGYVNNDYIYMDEEAINLVADMHAFSIKITADTMNVREEPNTKCRILGQAKFNQEYTWYPELSDDEWYAIQFTEDKIAYVSALYTKSVSKLGNALTMEQEAARARAEMYAKAMEHSKKYPPTQTNRPAIEVSDEDLYLMAVVIASEALWEPYEGKLMVANVIVNRMLNGHWGKTVREVVYAKGQFEGSDKGRFDAFWNRANEDCKRAAYEAVMGNNNIEDYLFFIAVDIADFSKYYQYYVFHGHVFYKRHW